MIARKDKIKRKKKKEKERKKEICSPLGEQEKIEKKK